MPPGSSPSPSAIVIRRTRLGDTLSLPHVVVVGSGPPSQRPLPRYVESCEDHDIGLVALRPRPHAEAEPVGTAVLQRSNDDARVADIRLFVHPAHRRRGVGRMLLARLCELAKTEGVEALQFTLVLDDAESRRPLERLLLRYRTQALEDRLRVTFSPDACLPFA